MKFRCVCCQNSTITHPNHEDCETIDGKCAFLVQAGWKDVWSRIYYPGYRKPFVVKGGWLCPKCAKKYKP